MGNKNTTRLGAILVSKGLITQAQLIAAVNVQHERRKLLSSGDKSARSATSLGEILIEMGFIDRLQLKRGLNWQMIVRKMTLAMALVAPFMSLSSGAAAASSSSSSSSKSASSLPLKIQAEDYTSMSGIQTQVTTDTGAGSNVGYLDAGDWMSYKNITVNIPVTGAYQFTYRVASPGGGGSLVLKESDDSVTYDTIPIPDTGGWQTWQTVTRKVNLSAGTHSFKIAVSARGAGFNFNWFNIDMVGLPLPVTIQAETYNSMSGVQIEPTADVGGGSDVGYLHPGDWMSYLGTNVSIPKTGSYKVSYRVAAPGTGASFVLKDAVTNAIYDKVAVPSTGGGQTWTTVEHIVTLPAGNHSFLITDIVRGAGLNINWFKVENVASSSSSSSSSKASSSSSSKAASVASNASSSKASSSTGSIISATGEILHSILGGPVGLKWLIPNQRENGLYLDITEIGGYEVRYKKSTDADYTYVTIGDAWTNYYNLPSLDAGDYSFQVASFDKNGLYSNFIDLAPL